MATFNGLMEGVPWRRQEATPRLIVDSPLTLAAVLAFAIVSFQLLPLLLPPLVQDGKILGSLIPSPFLLERPELQNHRLCGLTTGGQDECIWDCNILVDPSFSGRAIGNLTCLLDCFPPNDNPNSDSACIVSLLKDVLSKGTCQWEGNGESEGWNNPSEWGYSDSCDITETDDDYYSPDENGDCQYDYEYYDYEDYRSGRAITGFCDGCGDCTAEIIKGTCSTETEALMQKDKCMQAILEQNPVVVNTLQQVIQYSCTLDADPFAFNRRKKLYLQNKRRLESNKSIGKARKVGQTKLPPITTVTDTYHTELNFDNTRHRYPWICSLRTIEADPKHLCAVTLLSVPPQPTVIVGAAHCTYICKDRDNYGRNLPTCCCIASGLGTESCTSNWSLCGIDPVVVEADGRDMDILCGEWQTGNTTQEESGERYNVVLIIEEVVRHPEFDAVNEGVTEGRDIAIFKVKKLQQPVFTSKRIYPICLPPKDRKQPQEGIHSGWAAPPPREYLEKWAPPYLDFYKEFFKQWHYKMNILDRCKDFNVSQAFGEPLRYPTNTYYPAGTICASEASITCFTPGDSASPLMVREEKRPMRYYIEGVYSGDKGCETAGLGKAQGSSDDTEYQFIQFSNNPAIYTKLSCFLPWVAEQYGLSYDYDPSTDEACTTSTGSKVADQPCRETIGSSLFAKDRECIFPFYYKGKLYRECLRTVKEGFLYPIFRCPVFNITTKIDGINSFEEDMEITDGYCADLSLTDPDIGLFVLNPSWEPCPAFQRVNPFSTCQNDCPGVRAIGTIAGGGIIGGGAVFFTAASGLAGQSLLAVLGLGVLGGGAVVTRSMCLGPLYCRSRRNQCCLVRGSNQGPRCPRSC